jgi:hypothetical protein
MATKYKRPRGRPPKGINPRTGNKLPPPRSRNPYGNPNLGAIVSAIWNDPEKRAEFMQKRQEGQERRTENIWKKLVRYGIPHGMRRPEAANEWAFARMYAKEVTRIMKEEDLLPEDPKVEKAFTAAVEVLESPMSQTIKLQAARLILDFCKAKPVAKSEVTVKSAEDWLQQVTADHLAKVEGEK